MRQSGLRMVNLTVLNSDHLMTLICFLASFLIKDPKIILVDNNKT